MLIFVIVIVTIDSKIVHDGFIKINLKVKLIKKSNTTKQYALMILGHLLTSTVTTYICCF